jgi:hypothetical protein
VRCSRIDYDGKDGEQVLITWTGVVKRSLFMPVMSAEENHRKQDVSMSLDQQA